MHAVRVIGLTGNIAAGKSEVAKRLVAKGAYLIDADRLAREAVVPGSPGLAAIRARFGDGVIAKDGTLDRAALRHVVFHDGEARRALDGIVHPEVARLRARETEKARTSGASLIVNDIPLLFEVGLEHTVETIVLVDAPVDQRRARLMRDRGLSPSDADAMIAAQLPSAEKRARADHIIDNTGDLAALDRAVNALWDELHSA